MPNIVTIDGIPVYQALVDDADCGMLRISLVDDPAVQSNFVAFSAQHKPSRVQTYSIEDEEKRLVLGVVMRADFPIYRREKQADGSDFEFYIIYKADTIRAMAEKYLAENRQNLVNTMHEDDSDVQGVQMVQYFIKGGGIAPDGFEDIADGSLFAEFHIVNDEIWAAVKDGTYKGFSLEGVFDLVPERDKASVSEIVDTLDGVFRNINPNYNNMTKVKGLLARLAEALANKDVKMGSVSTDKGVVAWDGEEDIKAGDAAYVVDEEGNRTPAPDGVYTTGDGKTIEIVDGKVAAITDPSAEVAPAQAAEEPAAPAEPAEQVSKKNTDKGEIEWDGSEDLKEGDAVYVRDAEGNRVPAADGDYVTEDGKTISVVDGKVASIADPAAEVAPAAAAQQPTAFQRIAQAFAETYEDKVKKIYDAIAAMGYDPYGWLVEAGDEYAIYSVWGNSGEEFYRFTIKEWDDEGNPVLENGVKVVPAFVTPEEKEKADEAFAAAEREIDDLRAQVKALQAKPAAKSAHEEFESTLGIEKTGDKGLDNLARVARAK